jgi:hypothetical protein
MPVVCFFPVASMAASLVGQALVVALAMAPQPAAGDVDAPTPKEQALIEQGCPAPLTPAAYAAHERCLAARLLSLRADFGRDLSQLSTAARKKLDSACSPVQAARGREAYVSCLSVQLASLSAARVRATPSAPAEVSLPAPIETTTSAVPLAPVPQASSIMSVQSAVVFLAVFAGVTALVMFGVKAKRARHACRVCGVRVPGAGDLCTACRHEAAEAVRHAAAERVERQRADEAEQRREREHADAQVQAQLRQEEERLRRLEEGRRLEEETRRREEDARQREEDARQAAELERTQAAAGYDATDMAFDPYLALGLAPDASGDQVRAAYEEAKLKYDPDQVAHLGDDAQAHYAAKSRTAERAYQMLVPATAQLIE